MQTYLLNQKDKKMVETREGGCQDLGQSCDVIVTIVLCHPKQPKRSPQEATTHLDVPDVPDIPDVPDVQM